ncbi:MAG: CRTAC1 family protein [Planctomycetota bacterium]
MPSRTRPIWLAICVVAVSLSIAGSIWWLSRQHTEVVEADPTLYFADGSPRQQPEFERIAERLFRASNFFKRGITKQLGVQRQQPAVTDEQWLNLTYSYVENLLWEGSVEEACVAADEMVARAERMPGGIDRRPFVLRMRALAYLRRAEVENCVRRHNRDCCVFPLQGGGVHTGAPEFVRQARADYLRLMQIRPLLEVRWLLNLTNMALGKDVTDLAPRQRIPSDTHATPGRLRRFKDVAVDLGVDAFNLAGGSIADDFDGDGLLDIVTSSLGPREPLRFFRNSGDGTFEDRSQASRLTDQWGGLNVVSTDYDNDGDLDVFVLRGAWLFDAGRVRNSLLRNDGDGVFTDVTRSVGLAGPAAPTQTAAWFDYDNDGDLDLYVGNESRADRTLFPEEKKGDYPSQLFRNDGVDGFVDVAATAGVTNDRYCKGVAAGDFDNDGFVDLYVSNIGRNRLYRNRGDGTFVDVAEQLGVTEPSVRSFATWFFDYDNDGWLDLFVAAYDAKLQHVALSYLGKKNHATPPALYRNLGNGTFENVAARVGLDRPFLPMGANFGDLDGDGWLDLYLATGDPQYESLMPDVVLCNEGGKHFVDVTTASGLGHLQKGHGVSFADFDNDGDQDIYHQLGGFYPGDRFQNALFVNPGHDAHSLKIVLVGRDSNRLGYGARIKVTLVTPEGERVLHRAVGSTSSFGGSTNRTELGLGDALSIGAVEVYWPVTKQTQRFDNVSLDSCIEIVEGGGLRVLPTRQFSLSG